MLSIHCDTATSFSASFIPSVAVAGVCLKAITRTGCRFSDGCCRAGSAASHTSPIFPHYIFPMTFSLRTVGWTDTGYGHPVPFVGHTTSRVLSCACPTNTLERAYQQPTPTAMRFRLAITCWFLPRVDAQRRGQCQRDITAPCAARGATLTACKRWHLRHPHCTRLHRVNAFATDVPLPAALFACARTASRRNRGCRPHPHCLLTYRTLLDIRAKSAANKITTFHTTYFCATSQVVNAHACDRGARDGRGRTKRYNRRRTRTRRTAWWLYYTEGSGPLFSPPASCIAFGLSLVRRQNRRRATQHQRLAWIARISLHSTLPSCTPTARYHCANVTTYKKKNHSSTAHYAQQHFVCATQHTHHTHTNLSTTTCHSCYNKLLHPPPPALLPWVLYIVPIYLFTWAYISRHGLRTGQFFY